MSCSKYIKTWDNDNTVQDIMVSEPRQGSMSYSTYITTWDSDPYEQVEDMIAKFVLKPGTRVILAFASYNFSSTEYIPGLDALTLSDLLKLCSLVHSKKAKISLSIGGATYPFANSDLYSRPGDLAYNINTLLTQCGFDGVDFDIEDSSSGLPSDFVNNAASMINTLRSLNSSLYITLTTPAQAWLPNNYQYSLLNLTLANINAWQPMEYDLWIEPTSEYTKQIQYDIDFYLTTWHIDPTKIILGLMPGKDDSGQILTLQNTSDLTKFANTNFLQGVMTWNAYNDSTGCDGNLPYDYSLEIQNAVSDSKSICTIF